MSLGHSFAYKFRSIQAIILLFAAFAWLFLALNMPVQAMPTPQKVEPLLRQRMAESPPQALIPVIVTLKRQAKLAGIGSLYGREARLRRLVNDLKAQAERSQGGLHSLLQARQAQGEAAGVVYYWIFNGLALQATPRLVEELASLPQVLFIRLERTFSAPTLQTGQTSIPEDNLVQIGATSLWDLGFQGQGVVVANLDTGVDGGHPDLAPRWRGGNNSWYDPYGQHTTPADLNGHGSATMGVMVGDGAGGTAIGVAPQAQWIAVKIFNDSNMAEESKVHLAFQWLLDPDGNPNTADAPQVVNNSWAFAAPGCDLTFQADLQALRAAGILPVFAAGNLGPGPDANTSTSTSPGNNPEAFAVGAVDKSDGIWSGSSRGPSHCDQTLFPEVVAPGSGIRSADKQGGYQSWSGTSLAAPHVAGGLALLLDAFPDLTVDEQEQALIASAVDLGEPGGDNTYGYGRIDLLAAYQWLSTHHQTATPAPTSTILPAATPTPQSTPSPPPPAFLFLPAVYR